MRWSDTSKTKSTKAIKKIQSFHPKNKKWKFNLEALSNFSNYDKVQTLKSLYHYFLEKIPSTFSRNISDPPSSSKSNFIMKRLPNLLAVVFFVLVLISIQSKPSLGSSDEAYVTLLYGDEFLLGVRVLGKSIRDTGSRKDMVALISDGVSEFAQKLLEVTSSVCLPRNSSSQCLI